MKVRLPNMTANSAGMVSFNSEVAATGIKPTKCFLASRIRILA